MLLPGALTGIYGLQNDTIIQAIQVDQLKSYGNLSLQFDSLSADSSYYVELLGKGDERISTFTIKGDSTFQRTFRALPSGTYTVRFIEDWNGNGQWDTGNYDEKRQPEPIYLRPLEQLRSNWDLEAAINLVDLRKEALAPPAPAESQGQETDRPPSGVDRPGRKPPSGRNGN